jgi:hypothetical protein
MKTHMVLRAISTLVILTIGALCCAGEQAAPRASSAPTIEGTYALVSRKLPDGTMQRAPEIMGLLTYTKSHRNFNVIWKDATGKIFSYSLASTYKLTPTEYSETILFSILKRSGRWQGHRLRLFREDPKRAGESGRWAPPVQAAV